MRVSFSFHMYNYDYIQGIIVSNHGGRQLDGVPATIDVLSEKIVFT